MEILNIFYSEKAITNVDYSKRQNNHNLLQKITRRKSIQKTKTFYNNALCYRFGYSGKRTNNFFYFFMNYTIL